ncbi:hypothetical protein PaeBR_17010 [Paenibacillus sp. BR2-3]|uniref:hypothetical protein n=1 Tax=Paenibacillus sp. BR2-3 TaxID=3048494 RepID=UPI003977D167
MLQIISGKFYKTNSIEAHEGLGVLYSNLRLHQPLKTCIGTLTPIDTHGVVSSYVFSYTNQLEVEYSGGATLVRTGDPEIIHQFKLLCYFGLKAFFSTEKNDVILNCRSGRSNITDYFQPYKYVSRYFNEEISCSQDDLNRFVEFVSKVISLPRIVYKLLIACLDNLYHSFLTLNHNIDLSYSLIVYCLESLSQNFDQYEPTWNDYDQNVRTKLDKILFKIDDEKADNIRQILAQSSHLKLQKRFVDFIQSYIDDEYFINIEEGVHYPLRKSDVSAALINAYTMRSQYVHKLGTMIKQLKIDQIAGDEVFTWDNTPYLTFNGFQRLVRHVIINFINYQPSVEREEYNWRDDLPGIVYFKLSPEYWVHQSSNFTYEYADKKLEGFLQIVEGLFRHDSNFIDISELMKVYDSIIFTSPRKHQLPMVALYLIYTFFFTEIKDINKYQKIIGISKGLFKECWAGYRRGGADATGDCQGTGD